MNFTIKDKRQEKDTLFTEVEFNFNEADDGITSTINVTVPHFRPESAEIVRQSIYYRGESELLALLAAEKIKNDVINNL